MTYSIIGRDRRTGDLGVALQSYYYGCAPRTLLAEPGVGIVVMQMIPDMMYGTRGMAQMKDGRAPAAIIQELISADPARDSRQVAMMSAGGDVAAFTGPGCIPASGHVIGEDCSAQGAMVEGEEVWQSMADAFESATGPLPERMICAMRAGESAGGDIRGKRAAAMLVVSSDEPPSWVASRPINIRVDDHPDPLAEVERHLALQRHMGAIELAFERGLGGDVEGAVDEYARIAQTEPDDPDVTMRYAIMLAKVGDIVAAREQLLRMSQVHGGWTRVTGRLVAAGLLPDDRQLLEGLPLY